MGRQTDPTRMSDAVTVADQDVGPDPELPRNEDRAPDSSRYGSEPATKECREGVVTDGDSDERIESENQ